MKIKILDNERFYEIFDLNEVFFDYANKKVFVCDNNGEHECYDGTLILCEEE